MTAPTYYKQLLKVFKENSVPENIPRMKSYMKNRYDFFGIKSPQRQLILRQFTKEHGIPEGEDLMQFVKLMWENPHRELQYAAMDLMGKRTRKMDDAFLPFFEELILNKSWWDTVDWLAPNGSGKLFTRYPDQILPYTQRWNLSDNIWLVRSSLLFQLKYREQTDFELLKQYILQVAESKEFFIQKGAGWALRQYAKYNPNSVATFVNTHKSKLSNLTIREALKHIGDQ